MFAILVLFSTLFTTAETLMCFECKEGNERDCNTKQEKIECKNFEDHCFTAFTGRGSSEKITKQAFWKGCVDGKKCQKQCSWYEKFGRTCKVSCCLGNECNEHGIPKQRNKRQYNNTGESILFEWWLLLFCIVLPLLSTTFS